MWKSLVATTWSQRWFGLASATEMPAATSAPPATASEPPSQKSFWTSTMINARIGALSGGGYHGHGDRRIAGGQLEAFPRDGDESVVQVFPALFEGGQVLGRFAADQELPLEQAGTGLPVRYPLGNHDLLRGGTGGLVPPYRRLPPTHGGLVLAALDHRPALDLDQLVDQPGGWRARPADHRCAGAVAVHRLGRERGDAVLVE